MEDDLKCSISSVMKKGSEHQGSSAILRIQLANMRREARIGLRRQMKTASTTALRLA